jgi:hypothetical protein
VVPSKNSKPSASARENVFYGTTLKEAYRQVENRYGKNAIILGSRKITRRQETGLGHEELVEVTVQPPGEGPVRAPSATMTRGDGIRPAAGTHAGQESTVGAGSAALVREITEEVERIERLVREATRATPVDGSWFELEGNPLAEALLGAGATRETVSNLLTRFAGETGSAVNDRPAALAWLTRYLKASNCGWDGFFGCHAFLGESGSGRTSLVLGAAAEQRAHGRRTLVLNLHPAHAGEIRRLQNAAANHGFDAAILRKDSQLERSESHLAKYEVVLLDLPALDHRSLAPGGEVHRWLARNPGFHRHLVVPLDRDLQDLELMQSSARDWNCDWLAVNRLDRTRLQGKLLDLAESIPLPYSLTGEVRGGAPRLTVAASGELLDRILGAGADHPAPGFEAGHFTTT